MILLILMILFRKKINFVKFRKRFIKSGQFWTTIANHERYFHTKMVKCENVDETKLIFSERLYYKGAKVFFPPKRHISVKLVDLIQSFHTTICFQKAASVQPRTSF